MRDTGCPAAEMWRNSVSTLFRHIDLSYPSVIFIWRFIRRFDLSISTSHLYLSYFVIVFCRFIMSLSLLPYLLLFTNAVILCRLLLSCSSVIRICHLHLAFWTCHLQSFCHCILSFTCTILLACAFVVFIWHSICQFAILLMQFCYVMFFCRYSAVLLVVFLCHCLLSCCSVLFFCHLPLTYSFGILLLSFTVVFCSWHFLT